VFSAFSANNYIVEYGKAQEYLQRAMPDLAISKLYNILENEKVPESFKDTVTLTLSEGFRQKREFEKGIRILHNLILKQQSKKFIVSKAYNRIAALYDEWLSFGKTRLDSTIKYSKLSLAISEKNNYKDIIASSQNELGFVYIKLKDFTNAKKYLLKAFNNYYSEKKYLYSANVALNISIMHVKQAQLIKAITVLDSAIVKISEKEFPNMFMRIYLQKADIYAKQGRYDSAYKYLSLVRIMQKNLFHNKMDEKIYEMSAKYDLKLKEAKLKEIEHYNIQKRNENKFLILLISSMVVLFIVLVYIVYLKRKTLIHKQEIAIKEKIILEENIKYKNNELANVIAYSAASNEILKKIKKLLDEKKYSEIRNTINTNINTENNWRNFLIKFSENYPNFFYLLEKEHPNLTKSETKLSALLLMKLSSKEIAYILNIELASVNKSRQRLRKKLSIDTNISFTEYFKQF